MTITITLTDAQVAAVLAAAAPPPVVVPPPVIVVPPPPTPFLKYRVYDNGVQGGGDGNWVSDFDGSGTITTYKDPSGAPDHGTYCLKIDPNGQAWAYWLPYANNPLQQFDLSPYTSLSFQIKPTVDNAAYQVYFVAAKDIPLPSKYTVRLAAGSPWLVSGTMAKDQWSTFDIPLSVLGVAGQNVYKFAIQSQTGSKTDVVRYNRVGFR